MSTAPEIPPGMPPKINTEMDKDDRTWALMAHLSGILAGVLTGFFLSFLGPLIIWQVKKDRPFVADQGKEALNFQLTMLIGFVIAYAVAIFTCGIGIPLLAVPGILQLVLNIIGGIKANEGQYYRYPINIRFF